ncbi:phage N-6-adenine-methyltransferase [Enterocloster clostridioformis]|uniref:DNA N-6-adenine-methyltransferase of bacteriophage n=1 Tax=Enterocloster clostridioformis TaxID=1531 RepID=A0A2X2UEM9_9FIRM|nr:phage N-6-adenine-methyltransferase [Enterocloster clostridioformis]SQB14894.1 DNA N-6-adenine-methyltransferase of bacteriophage [Enterocloster clostridioformis]
MNTKTLFSSKTDKWATPQTFFDELNREFDFNLDPCADETNHKCEKYFTEEENGLLQDWGGGGVPGILQPTIWQQYKRLGG